MVRDNYPVGSLLQTIPKALGDWSLIWVYYSSATEMSTKLGKKNANERIPHGTKGLLCLGYVEYPVDPVTTREYPSEYKILYKDKIYWIGALYVIPMTRSDNDL